MWEAGRGEFRLQYLSEAWKLLKRSWWRIVKFVLLMMIIRVLVFGLEFGIGFALFHLSKAWCSSKAFVIGFAGFYTLVGLAGVLPAEKYVWYSVISSASHTKEPRLWQLYFQSFRSCTRMIMGGFWWGVFASPLMVVGLILLLPGLPGGFDHWHEYLSSFVWRTAPLFPFLGALSVYGSFAVLGIVREGQPALASWRQAFSLIPRREWLGTVGLLSVLYFVAVFVGLLLERIPWFSTGLASWFASALLGGLTLCHFALWRTYRPGEGGGATNSPNAPVTVTTRG